jgi:hypothetical protein
VASARASILWLGLVKVTGYQAVRIEAMTSDDYDRRTDSLGW